MISKKPTGRLGIFSWMLFDWAHAAFPTVIITFIFSTYFMNHVAHNELKGTAYWGWMMSVSGIVIAILSPFIGSIADYTGRRKPWLMSLLLINIIFTILLWMVKPSADYILLALVLVGIANVAYELTQIFYNGMMVDIAPSGKIGRMSGWGWAFGYLGGLVCLVISLFFFIKSGWFSSANGLNVRAVTIFVSAWFLVFAVPLFLYTPDTKPTGVTIWSGCCRGGRSLWHTIKKIHEYEGIFMYLLAHLIYIDGLNTLFIFAGIFAAGSFHMNYTQIVIFAIVLNVTAGIGAFLFAWVDDWLGPKFTIGISLFALLVLGAGVLLTHSIVWFWVIGSAVGLFVGPVQAASRSYMAQLAPKELLNQMFGIYQLSGRITAFIGPVLVSAVTEAYASQRAGMSMVFFMMLIGLILLLFVPSIPKRS